MYFFSKHSSFNLLRASITQIEKEKWGLCLISPMYRLWIVDTLVPWHLKQGWCEETLQGWSKAIISHSQRGRL